MLAYAHAFESLKTNVGDVSNHILWKTVSNSSSRVNKVSDQSMSLNIWNGESMVWHRQTGSSINKTSNTRRGEAWPVDHMDKHLCASYKVW